MPSNVRTGEKSCQSLANGYNRFYKCLSCDPTGQLYLCSHCLSNAGHYNHNCQEVCEEPEYYDIYFCNCGDITGRLCCAQHKRFRLKNRRNLPLHFNCEFRWRLTKGLNLEDSEAKRFSRLNQIKSIGPNSLDGRLVNHYFNQTNAHDFDIRIRKILSVYRKEQEQNFVKKGFHKGKNRYLLWHGTPKDNVVNILDNGFYKPESGDGLMFGSGVYFADRVSKSITYCNEKNPKVLLLCEVALGRMYNTVRATDFDRAPKRFSTVKALGKNEPKREEQEMFGDVIVPLGKTVPNRKVKNAKLNYNEYIVFNPERILVKFIVFFDRYDQNLRTNEE